MAYDLGFAHIKLCFVPRNDYIRNTVRTKHDQIFLISNIFGITTIKVYESNIDDVIIRKIHLCSSKYVHQSLSMNLSSSKSTLDWWYITPSHCFIAFLLQRQTFVRIHCTNITVPFAKVQWLNILKKRHKSARKTLLKSSYAYRAYCRQIKHGTCNTFLNWWVFDM